MKYFNTLPTILSSDNAGNLIALKNLLTRVHLNKDTIKNPLLFYSYDIQEGDTPEIVAQKYYGSVDYFWVVMFGAQLIDPEWDWPMSSRVFSEFIIDKYGSTIAANSLIDHYEKSITISSSLNNDHTTDIVVIDEHTYVNTIVETHSYRVPTGEIVTISTNKRPVTAYENETILNEKRRSINLINERYVSDLTQQFQTLMKLVIK
jgi:hypothetical protein